MDDDGVKSDEFQQSDIFDDILLQLRVLHRGPAILYDDDLAVVFLNVGKRLNQHLRLSLCLVNCCFHLKILSCLLSHGFIFCLPAEPLPCKSPEAMKETVPIHNADHSRPASKAEPL